MVSYFYLLMNQKAMKCQPKPRSKLMAFILHKSICQRFIVI